MNVPVSNNQVKPGIRMIAPVGNPGILNLSSLEEVGLVKPEVLTFVSNWYLEHVNPLTKIIMYLGGKVDLTSGSLFKHTDEMSTLAEFENFVRASVKKIDRYRFMYNVPVSGKQMPFFTRPAEGERNSNNLLINKFSVYVSTNEIGVDETIILANQPVASVLKVLNVEHTGNILRNGRKETKLTVQAMLASGPINPLLVDTNQQFAFGYHIAPEASTRGMKPKTQGFGQNFVHNVITTMRGETAITGHAMNSGLNNKVFEYIFPDGKGSMGKIKFYIDYQRDQMYRDRVNSMAQYILNGQRETADGTSIDPRTGKTVFAGDGILALTNPKLRRPITGSIINYVRGMAEIMMRDDPNASTVNRAKYVILCPMSMAKSVSDEIGRVFGVNPLPLFVNEGGNRGVDSSFNLYRTIEADYFFVGHNLFNSRQQPALFNPNGEMVMNNCIYMLNVSTYDKGQSNVVLVQNREMIIGAKIQGMATAKSGTVLSTTADVDEIHDLLDIGVAVPNPNFLSIGYITK